MENAGAGAARILAGLAADRPEDWPEPFQVLCGPGNNGGDGFVVARHLHNRGFAVAVHVIGAGGYAPGSDAAVNHEVARRMGLPLRRLEGPPDVAEPALAAGTVVDALFGTGLARPLAAPFLDWVRAVNASGRPVAALDVPSGLDADTGVPLGAAIAARVTITFAAPKLGFARGEGPRLAGEVHVVDIGIPREIWEGRAPR
jgi:NAD(P)H-hydrate epimerase